MVRLEKFLQIWNGLDAPSRAGHYISTPLTPSVENYLTQAHEICPARTARRELSMAYNLVGLPLTVSEIYGVKVRSLTSIIFGTADPIEFEFRRSLDYDLYKLPWSEGYIWETVRDRHTQKRGVILTFLKIWMIGVGETLPDDSIFVTDIWAKLED
jgi:hypothetical protein